MPSKYPMPPKKTKSPMPGLPQMRGVASPEEAEGLAERLARAAEEIRAFAPRLALTAAADAPERYNARTALAVRCKELVEAVAVFADRI